MVNVAVVGPRASGKTLLCYQIANVDCVARYCVTCTTQYLACTIHNVEYRIWDTPPPRTCQHELARGVIHDSDIIVVCHDGRKDVSPVDIVRELGADRCMIALTSRGAFDVPTAKETFDLVDSKRRLVPVVPAWNGVQPVLSCIYHTMTVARGLA